MTVRQPAVAGTFYPGDARELSTTVDALLAAARARVQPGSPRPKAIVVPHAGYIYSGPVAATAYAAIDPAVRRVVLFGPAHRVAFNGLALPSVDAFATPLGEVPIDAQLRSDAQNLAGVGVDDRPHATEHSLEVQLPFLQRTLENFTLTPFAVGGCDPDTVAAVVDAMWGGPETLVVISTDLSHYESYDTAAAHDRRTAAAIVAGRGDAIAGRDACGAIPLRGLLAAVQTQDLAAQLLDLRSSGDTSVWSPASRERVVGYGAFAFAGTPHE